ncbi:MAG TPA: DinB family protein, partial [Puia sp.]|nr:DinB family protein [Puia sp.]
DRLLTYARDQALTAMQLEELKGEGAPSEGQATVAELLNRFNIQVDKALDQISETPETILTDIRYVGRSRIPSTVAGLLFHAAEHTMRHTGQLLVTARVLMGAAASGNPYEQ